MWQAPRGTNTEGRSPACVDTNGGELLDANDADNSDDLQGPDTDDRDLLEAPDDGKLLTLHTASWARSGGVWLELSARKGRKEIKSKRESEGCKRERERREREEGESERGEKGLVWYVIRLKRICNF
jgi:hypothetical protein